MSNGRAIPLIRLCTFSGLLLSLQATACGKTEEDHADTGADGGSGGATDPEPGGGTGGTEPAGGGGASGAAPSCEPSSEKFADAADSNCDGLTDPAPCEEEPVDMAVTCGDVEFSLAETLQCLEPNCTQALHLRLSNTGSDAVEGNVSFELFTDEEGTDLLSSRSYLVELEAGAQSVPLFVGDLLVAPESHFLRLTVESDCSTELLEIRSLIFECGFFL